MPAVKVFNIFGGQKPADKHQAPPSTGTVQKFYRTFSVAPENSPEKGGKVTAIAACLEKKISDPPKPSDSKPSAKLIDCEVVNKTEDLSARFQAYENIGFGRKDDKLLEETKGYSSIYENVTVLGKLRTIEKLEKSQHESKLNKALETFDRILSEFSSSTSLSPDINSSHFIVPKLQKSKTCSIIESHCILKKADSDPENTKKSNQVSRNNSLEKTTSLWNLDDMKEKELSAPLKPLSLLPTDKMNPDKYATYKVSSKSPRANNYIKTEDLKRLDVKTRILKKTLSNPPSTPVPVVPKSKISPKKLEPKKQQVKQTKSFEGPKVYSDSHSKASMQKAKSVWEIGNEMIVPSNLERTKSTTSIAGSPSKIPVVRSQMSQNKFSSTRALFSPTPVDLNNLEQARECAQRKKPTTPKSTPGKIDVNKQVKQKSQINLKADAKRSPDKNKKEVLEKKGAPASKSSLRDYSDEISAVRAKIQDRKSTNKRDIAMGMREAKAEETDSVMSPVKYIVKKLEIKTAMESKPDAANFVSCKVIPPVHKEICVANTTFHNHLSTLVSRQICCVQARDDAKSFCDKHIHKHDEKISDTHSDCSDDSGHVSNDTANDTDAAFDNTTSPGVDEMDCKLFEVPKKFGVELPKNARSVCPVRPARRRPNEVDSGTAAPKLDEQIMFRGGVVGELDARRDAALARVLVRLQARARGLLARRKAQRLRTQHTAARCIQRNVRAFLTVRDWPWWRLLVRVTPLLAVHRTEHRLKQAQDELETLKSKLEKIDSERTHYKNETERLETKLSEVGGELAEERAAAALATERADAEAAERLRIERDNRELLANNQRLQQASERLELELLHWRSAENGTEHSDSEGSEGDASGEKYKRRFERAHRELQLLRVQLRRQHEDDLEQLVTVKKQLEKKVQDAYEEVEEQRAVAAQWKRKLQKLTNDMADLRSLLDEQTCRNNLLEKRQRKFDAELHSAQEELKRERAAKERLSRERDQAHAEKYALEQSLSEARLEVEMKEERLAAAARELEARGGAGGDEAAALRRARTDLERRLRDQEEELDDLAGQIQLLESSKLRLEMLLEQQRKEARLEAAARDDEIEETRANASKKLKMLESQLESEHSERSLLQRERHELERRLAALEETARAQHQDNAQLVTRLKRDLKRYRALLRDAQTMLEQKEKEGGGKAQIRQLKNQVEDLELAVRAANKARSSAEAEASEAATALDEANRARAEAAERALAATRDAATARAQLDDAEEEAAELLKKYRTCTSALCAAQSEAREAEARAEAASEEARAAKERLAELSARLASAEAGHDHEHHEAERRLELRNKELESRLEVEATCRSRAEAQATRLRDAHDALAAELAAARARDLAAAEDARKLARQIRELKEENSSLNTKLSEVMRGKAAAEAAAAAAAAEAQAARDEARLAARRATALQEAIAGDLSSPGDSRDTDSDNDSYSSDESIGTFLANHKLSPSAASAPSRNSVQLDSQKSQSPEGRTSRSSAGSAQSPGAVA